MGVQWFLVLIWLQFEKVISDCPSPVYPGEQGFGPQCRYRCNCKDRWCDNETGECLRGCLSGWMGPSCQYRNIANLIRRTEQIPRSDNSNLAKDGDVDTCSRTGNAKQQVHVQRYWQAELREQMYIVGFVIKITRREQTGFSIDVGNSSNSLTKCYRHGDRSDKKLINEVFIMEVNCQEPVVGNHLRIRLAENENADLVLCEVEIYGGRLVSFNKPTDSVSTLYYLGFWNSSYAVDGRRPLAGENQDNSSIRTCTATEDSRGHHVISDRWWEVNLNNNYSIMAIDFYGRYMNDKLERQYAGFYLKVGLDHDSLHQVFQDKNGSAQDYQPRSTNLAWPVTGSVVRVARKNGDILVVCELEVFADCPLGRCGWECNETCMCKSQTTGIHKIQGTCPYGCSGRWTGPNNKCNKSCPNDKWGPSCNNECTGHCDRAEPCEASTGFCPGSCQPGWKSQKCNEECDNGTYGKNCKSSCGHCKDGMYCNRTSGHCGNGCKPGYQQPMCYAKCDNGTYGDGCVNKCGNCGNGDYCDHVTGDCPRGCSAGYKETKCISECDSNKYGNECSENCGNCKNGEKCNHISGKCENGCQPGWKIPLCKQPCDGGVYGDGCKDPCGHCLNNAHCTPVNGSCPGGCAGGYSGSVCKSECLPGFYGPNCEEKCGNCDNITNCDKVTGKCNSGCLPGWLGPFCINSCKDGFYGVNCQTPCGNCSNGEPCDKTSGYCRACAPGYQMKNCIETCVNRTYGENCALSCGHCDGNDPCDITNGICYLGCAEGFSGMFCHEDENSSHNKNNIMVGTIVPVALVIAAGLGLLFFIKKRSKSRQNETTGKKQRTPGVLELKDNLQKNNASTSEFKPNGSEPDVEATYNNTSNCTSNDDKSISVSELRAVCRSVKRDPTLLFAQFQEIPYGLHGDASESQDAAYKPKNRYRDMCPYNANRVLLPEIPGDPISTYINASYINGYEQYKKYIAAQGAIKTTINDIWRMIWSENINIIVMLTNCVEAGKMKCEIYWPEDGSLVYGTICTELVTVDQYADFVVRTFKCTKVSSKESRTVVQFHNTAWPDKDVPDTALSIVQFWRKVREHNPVNKKTGRSPWLVHCSAGVGRTGTFIAMDVLYDEGKAEGKVNIKEGVYRLREQRLNMVQTKEQYVFLFNVLAEILDPIGAVYRSEEFFDAYRKLISNKSTNKQKLFMEYQLVCKETDEFFQGKNKDAYNNLAPDKSGRSTACKHPENICKSRNPRIVIQEDRDRPRLCTPVQGCNDFINAVYIPTYRSRDHLILTQCPLENTVVDFIRMVWDCSVTDVVYLEEKLPRDGEAYWPINKKIKEVGPFKAELVSEQTTECYTIRKIRYTLSANKQKKDIRQYHFHHWPQKKEIPVDTSSMLRLISAVDEQFRKEDNSRLVIQCLDGAKRSGLFCVVYSVLERLQMDRQVAVAETVILARIKRRQIIDNFEQYKYCHDVVEEHLQSSNLYANLA